MNRPWLLLWLVPWIVAPTPGAVGSCSGDDSELEGRADIPAYCREREELVCVRKQLRGELSIVGQDDCRRDAIARCQRRFWASSCRPTRRDTEACLTPLRLLDRVDTPVADIPECNAGALRCAFTGPSDDTPQSLGAGGMQP